MKAIFFSVTILKVAAHPIWHLTECESTSNPSNGWNEQIAAGIWNFPSKWRRRGLRCGGGSWFEHQLQEHHQQQEQKQEELEQCWSGLEVATIANPSFLRSNLLKLPGKVFQQKCSLIALYISCSWWESSYCETLSRSHIRWSSFPHMMMIIMLANNELSIQPLVWINILWNIMIRELPCHNWSEESSKHWIDQNNRPGVGNSVNCRCWQ